jgi:hypothetical protein
MNKLEAAKNIADKYNESVKAQFLKFDEETLRLVQPEEFFARVYSNEDGVFVDFSMTALEDVINFDGYIPKGFGAEAYYSNTLEVYKS